MAGVANPRSTAAGINKASLFTIFYDIYMFVRRKGIAATVACTPGTLEPLAQVPGGVLRSSVADYQVVKALPSTGIGQARYLCQAPERLELEEPTVMITELAVDASGWRELIGNLSRLAGVESAHLLRLIEVGPDLDPAGAGVYLASEAPAGGSVGDPVEARGPSGQIKAVAEAARGAHMLHECGLAHGSIDTSSVFLTARGGALGPPSLGGQAGVVAGIRDWRQVAVLDPALLRGEDASRSSDIWALATTLHGLLSTRPLYPGIDSDPAVTAVQRVLFTRPEVDPSLPPEIAESLAACLADDPGERILSADEFADRLTAVGVGR
jgi:serine/threonine protein kinase